MFIFLYTSKKRAKEQVFPLVSKYVSQAIKEQEVASQNRWELIDEQRWIGRTNANTNHRK